MGQIIQVDVDGLNLVPHAMITQYGLVVANVYGRAWARLQASAGVGKLNAKEIAAELGLSGAAVSNALKLLTQENYLIDLTIQRWRDAGKTEEEIPELARKHHHSHEFQDTGKAGLSISIVARSGVNVVNTKSKNGSACGNVVNTAKSNGKSCVNVVNTEGQKDSGCVNVVNTEKPCVNQVNTEAPGVNVVNTETPLVVVVKDSLTNKEREELLQRSREQLSARGVGALTIEEFLAACTPERIALACDHYDWARRVGEAKNQGYLVSFLREGWAPLANYIPASERCPDCWKPLQAHAFDCPGQRTQYNAYTQTVDAREVVPVGEGGCADPQAAEWWEMVRAQLRMEMQPSVYRSRVECLVPAGFEEGVFHLAVADSDTRAWVESRLDTQITRLLQAIAGQELAVRFELANPG